MQYRNLDRTGVQVSTLALGAMSFGKIGRTTQQEATAIVDERNHQGSSRRWLVTELENSLRRMEVDHVDLYQVHRWDPNTSDEETSSVQAQWAGRENHHSRYVTEQPSYSILQRGIETHALPVTQQYGLGVLVWSPMASAPALLDPSSRRR